MATFLSDVLWVQEAERPIFTDDDSPLNFPWTPTDQQASPADAGEQDDQGEYEYGESLQPSRSRHFLLDTLPAAINTVLAVGFTVLSVVFIWDLVTGTPDIVDAVRAVGSLLIPLLLIEILRKAGSRRIRRYYKRLVAVTALASIAAMGYHWTLYAPMENKVVFLLGMGFIMVTFAVVVMAAVVFVPKY